MGLSDGERMGGVFWSVKRLYELPRLTEYCPDDKDTVINKMLDEIWSTFLSGSSNGGYWLFGGSLDSKSFSNEEDLVCIAFQSALSEDKPKSFFERACGSEMTDKQRELNEVFDWHDTYKPTMSVLLSHERFDGASYARTVNIYGESENYLYRANRYDDELSKKLLPLTKVITTLRGICLSRFATNPIYTHAWMTEAILNRCVGYEGDVVDKWVMSEYLQHHIRILKDEGEPMKSFKLWQLDKFEPTVEERVWMLLRLVGDSFHYQHQHQRLLKLLVEHNKTADVKVDLKRIEDGCARIHSFHEWNEKHKRKNYHSYCHLTQSDVQQTKPEDVNQER